MSAAETLPSEPSATGERSIEDCLTECLELTIEAFENSKIASGEEIARVRLRFGHAVTAEEPVDIIHLLARLQGTEEERMGIETARISHAVASVISPSPPLIPFAGKLMAPSSFYEAYTQLHELARGLLSPVIYAEDTDSIGTGALNPIAARIMADEIQSAVSKRFGINPFTTAVRTDYDSWTFLSRKHFGL
ncbi:hypothetical protein [Haloferula sp.]|uniref:hypothetical protein n=1 Tax=Haloferula sp. TaxID=2497595 RepID=UPI00329F1E0D